MPADLWTAEDVERVARAEYELGAIPGLHGIPWEKQEPYVQEKYRRRAYAGLAALAEAGRLLPADAETRRRTEWKYVLTYNDGQQKERIVDSLDIAEAVAASPADWNPPGRPGDVYERDITTTTWVGPWQPVGDTEPVDTPFCSRCGHACAHSSRHPLIKTADGLICEDAAACGRRLQRRRSRCTDCRDAPGTNANNGCEACAEHVVEGGNQ